MDAYLPNTKNFFLIIKISALPNFKANNLEIPHLQNTASYTTL